MVLNYQWADATRCNLTFPILLVTPENKLGQGCLWRQIR